MARTAQSLKEERKYGFAWNKNNVSEWSNMLTGALLFQ
jgi:hypothetical protein